MRNEEIRKRHGVVLRTGLAVLLTLMLQPFFLREAAAAPNVSDNSVSKNDLTKEGAIEEEADTGVKGFVTRLYKVCLDREPDEGGLKDWTGRLTGGSESGCSVAYGFVFSKEFQNKNLCNDCYVKQLYVAFMDREYDEGGFKYWTGQMQNGMTREEVFNGFVLSDEFKAICKDYGITVGEAITVPEYGTVPHGSCTVCGTTDGVTAFVSRLYSVCFGREPDRDGLDYWTQLLWSHERTGASVAEGFVFSEEFTNMELSDAEFLRCMYLAFFDREADADGYQYWMEQMRFYDVNRSHVFGGFVNGAEFNNLCNRFGIVRGSYVPVNDALTPQRVQNMSLYSRWYLISEGRGYTLTDCYMSEAETRAMMTTITVPVWDFVSPTSMAKTTKSMTLTINRNIAEYTAQAFQEIYASPDQPVIAPGHSNCYFYRTNVNNRSKLSTHAFGVAIDLNSTNNLNGSPMVTADAWAMMDESNVRNAQKKAYTIYRGSTIYNILCEKYAFYWGGYYSRTPDTMHFEFCQ